MVDYEIVDRKGGSAYLRKKFPRDFDSSSKNRKQNMIQFAELAISARGKSFEKMIDIMKMMKPIGITVKRKVIEMTPTQLRQIKLAMRMKGIKKITLPPGHIIIVRKSIPTKSLV